MNSILRFVQVIALGTWVGSIIYFIVVAQGVFGVLQSRDQTGLMVAYSLGAFALFGDGCCGFVLGRGIGTGAVGQGFFAAGDDWRRF